MSGFGRCCSLIPGLGVKLSTPILAGHCSLGGRGVPSVGGMPKARSPFRAHAKHRAISPPPPSRQGRLFPPFCWNAVISLCSLRGSLLRRPVELGPVDPQTMKNDCKVAGDSDLSFAETITLGKPHAHAFSADYFGTRVRSTLATSNKYVRGMASPHFEILPDQSTFPEEWRRVVNPHMRQHFWIA
jgi:hypothetical protein